MIFIFFNLNFKPTFFIIQVDFPVLRLGSQTDITLHLVARQQVGSEEEKPLRKPFP